MNYRDAIEDFFKSANWKLNLLLGAVCCLIPIVGPVALLGWLLGGFWGRHNARAETFPDFKFDDLMKYLERGLWPALISLVPTFVVSPVLIVVMALGFILVGGVATSAGENLAPFIVGAGTLVVGLIFLLVLFATMAVLMPLMLRAALAQDFLSAFNLAFVKRFLALTKTELALSILLFAAFGVALVIVGLVPCLGPLLLMVAVPMAMPLVYYAWVHLSKQLYQLYLSRGGEALTVSAKLSLEPPAVP